MTIDIGVRIVLCTGGTASAGEIWPGGSGCLVADHVSGTPTLQMSIDGGTNWSVVPEKETNGGNMVASGRASLFELPPCLIRLNAGGGSMNCTACVI